MITRKYFYVYCDREHRGFFTSISVSRTIYVYVQVFRSEQIGSNYCYLQGRLLLWLLLYEVAYLLADAVAVGHGVRAAVDEAGLVELLEHSGGVLACGAEVLLDLGDRSLS